MTLSNSELQRLCRIYEDVTGESFVAKLSKKFKGDYLLLLTNVIGGITPEELSEEQLTSLDAVNESKTRLLYDTIQNGKTGVITSTFTPAAIGVIVKELTSIPLAQRLRIKVDVYIYI